MPLFPKSILLAGPKHSTSVPFSARVVVHKKVTLDIHFVSSGGSIQISIYIKHGPKVTGRFGDKQTLKVICTYTLQENPIANIKNNEVNWPLLRSACLGRKHVRYIATNL